MNKKYYKKVTGFSFLILLCMLCINYIDTNSQNKQISNSYITAFNNNEYASIELYPNRKNLVIAEFTTEFDSQTSARGKNIIRGSIGVDQAKVMPGEVFSFNDTVGPTTEENGFHSARIFVDGKDEEGFGGGICQVSSTLYNSVLEANLEVVERHPHSKDVFYVAEDKDAATSYGSIDFKFKNTLQYPIKVNSYVSDNYITVALEYI